MCPNHRGDAVWPHGADDLNSRERARNPVRFPDEVLAEGARLRLRNQQLNQRGRIQVDDHCLTFVSAGLRYQFAGQRNAGGRRQGIAKVQTVSPGWAQAAADNQTLDLAVPRDRYEHGDRPPAVGNLDRCPAFYFAEVPAGLLTEFAYAD